MSPPGMAMFCVPRARWTSLAESEAAASLTGSIQTLIWRLRPPRIVTWPTPLMLSIWRRTRLSASSVTSR